MCQSIGAAGLAASTKLGVAAFGTGIGGLVEGLWPGGKKNSIEASEHSHDNSNFVSSNKGENSCNCLHSEDVKVLDISGVSNHCMHCNLPDPEISGQ